MSGPFSFDRTRRLRKSEALRKMVTETHLRAEHLVLPLFVCEGDKRREAIRTLPGIDRVGISEMLKDCEKALEKGIRAIAPFVVLEEALKDPHAKESSNPKGLYQRALRALKEKFPELVVFSDVAMDPYSSDGHDGFVRDGKILNDESLPILAKMAVTQAEAGADFVAPSDMMDGRIGYIRRALDEAGFTETGILSYAAKYASAFYGPFREALDSAPRFGDKKTYQMNPANHREALREVEIDVREGADIVMVKPGLPYLDIITRVRDTVHVPVAAYNVSGEYAMLQFAAQAGALDEERATLETLLAFRRAGADIIFTYHAQKAADWLR